MSESPPVASDPAVASGQTEPDATPMTMSVPPPVPVPTPPEVAPAAQADPAAKAENATVDKAEEGSSLPSLQADAPAEPRAEDAETMTPSEQNPDAPVAGKSTTKKREKGKHDNDNNNEDDGEDGKGGRVDDLLKKRKKKEVKKTAKKNKKNKNANSKKGGGDTNMEWAKEHVNNEKAPVKKRRGRPPKKSKLEHVNDNITPAPVPPPMGNVKQDEWWKKLEELKSFRIRHGHCKVTKKTANPALESWCRKNRVNYKLRQEGRKVDALSDLQIEQLETLGFQWNIQNKWDEWYKMLQEFKEEHGHTNVSARDKKNNKLGAWVQSQKKNAREFKEKGKAPGMTQERLELLEALDFDFSVRPWSEWDQRYEELKQYYAEHGNCRVPEGYEKFPKLYTFVSGNRFQYKLYKTGKKSKLTEERVQLLDEVNMEYGMRTSVSWEERFAELLAYKQEFGDCNVPQHWKPNRPLGKWVDTQRTQCKLLFAGKSSHMTTERITMLSKIGFDWR